MYWVYILSNWKHTVLYIGVTNDLKRRVLEHKTGRNDGFTSRYHVNKLVYFEKTHQVMTAIRREKELKGLSREKKYALVNGMNPAWRDLAADLDDKSSITKI
ncbi:MAG: GIY-YIG nuclease family protein [Clostridia bacterium]|nr:GIY-YIG nuclease family protein [Clostridia bacterium]MBQ8511651.1 GIY-YIG nuclease family protein [Clostridia bacterium]